MELGTAGHKWAELGGGERGPEAGDIPPILQLGHSGRQGGHTTAPQLPLLLGSENAD